MPGGSAMVALALGLLVVGAEAGVAGLQFGGGFTLEGWWGRGTGSVALVGGFAGGRRGWRGEAAVGAGVVEAKEVAVSILGDKGVVG